MPMITALYAGLLAIVYFYLTVRVIRLRLHHRVSLGHGGQMALQQAIRSHGNFAEYTPFFLILLALAELQGFAPLGLHGLGVLFLVSRLLHIYGVGLTKTPNARGLRDRKSRAAGMIGTLLTLLAAALVVLYQYLISVRF